MLTFRLNLISVCLHEFSEGEMKFHFCLFDRNEIRTEMSFISGQSCKRCKSFLLTPKCQSFISDEMKLSCKLRLCYPIYRILFLQGFGQWQSPRTFSILILWIGVGKETIVAWNRFGWLSLRLLNHATNLVKCNCKTNCAKRCKCKKQGMNCTELCGCGGGCNWKFINLVLSLELKCS